MRVLGFFNGRVGLECLTWLKAESPETELVGLVLNHPKRQRLGDDIVRASGLSEAQVFSWSDFSADPKRTVAALQVDGAVSVFLGHLLSGEILDLFERGVVNLHPALLPFNRGGFTNVWPLLDGSPAGVTLHLLDTGIDTGPILAQVEVPTHITDTSITHPRPPTKSVATPFAATAWLERGWRCSIVA